MTIDEAIIYAEEETEEQERMKHKHSHKSITIGPYTNAAALREIQKLIEEKFARGE